MSPMSLSRQVLTFTKYEMVTVNKCCHIYAPIVTAMKGPSPKIIIFHMKWWRSLSIIIINIREKPWMSPQHILSATPPLVKFIFLVTEPIVRHHCSYEMVTVIVRHYNSLLVTDLECHHNTYTFSDATFGDIQLLVMKAPLTLTNELMVTIFPLTNVLFSCSDKASHIRNTHEHEDLRWKPNVG